MNGQDATSFAVVLRSHRVAAGLTQEALAERSGLGVRSIQGLERGETHPRRETLRRMAGALGLTGERLAAFEVAGQPLARPRMSTRRVRAETGDRSGAASAPRHNLPGQLTTFIGRERERVALNDRLTTTRLLTLTGTGGCGKTRLALEVAHDAVAGCPDGVWLAELAALSDPALIAKAVATAIGVREAADRPVRETLLVALQSRRLLLLVDNCEHLLEGCAALVDTVLRTCPGVRVLATSREPLGLDGEVAWRVPSLSVAPGERSVDPARLRAYEAVRLFVDRASAAEPAFLLTEHNGAAISQICRRLDGIPLAIELAARRVTALSPDQIAERLDRRFHLLTRGSPAALPRQKTLAATVDWSYNLLSAPERVLFDRLAVFAGGFTLEAAEAVAGGAGEGTDASVHSTQGPLPTDILDLLTRLVDKSLVVADLESVGVERYRLLETLRQYAHERLAARGELEEMSHRHAVYYLEQAEEAGRHMHGYDQVRWLDRLDRDHANLQAALRWTIERNRVDLGMRLTASLAYFWYFRGHYSESRALRAAVLTLPLRPDLGALRSEVLQGGGMLALLQGDYAAARAFLEEGVSLARGVGDQCLLASALWTLGFVTRVACDYGAARSALVEALAGARAVGHAFHTAMALHHLGLLALEAEGDAETCWTLNEESLALHQAVGNRRMIGVTLQAMGRAARARGDPARARALIAEALALHTQVGDFGHVPQMLYHLAALDAERGQLERAVRVAASASRMSEEMGTRVWPVIQRERDAWLEPARKCLGDAHFALAWESGQTMTREQAVGAALAEDHPA